MGIPVPPRMTQGEIDAAERFSLAVWGITLFDREPSHNGRHGFGCEHCLPVLKAAQDTRKPVRQPWEVARAA